MDLQKEIAEAGRKAVLRGREIWGGPNDNAMREEFLSALIAIELHKELGKPVRAELEYTAIYQAIRDTMVPLEIISAVGSLRADVVIGDMAGAKFVPTAIVELKKFAEGGSIDGIAADLKKLDLLKLERPIQAYACVLVCETALQDLEDRKRVLSERFGERIAFSQDEKSKNTEWKWCFACISGS